jgi:plasmid stabilization system protein ParE
VSVVRFAPEAAEELAEAASWYEARLNGLGREFLAEVEAFLPLLQERPRSFPRLEAVGPSLEIRRGLLGRFPYALVFLMQVDEIRVLAVAHAKRRPGYWLSRVRSE